MAKSSRNNDATRFTRHLIELQTFAEDPVTVVDVGARDGFAPQWDLFGDQVRLIGFEADPEECERLNREAAGSNRQFFPTAVYSSEGRLPLYITAVPDSASLYKPNMRFLNRLPDAKKYTIAKTIEVSTIELDKLAAQSGIRCVDFLNIDVQGADLDVLRGAQELVEKSVLGLVSEVDFVQIYENQPLFADIDLFLRGLGFALFDLTLNRHARKELSPRMFSPYPGRTERGQLIWGEAVYLRDAVAELESGSLLGDGWNRSKVLKLASYMELTNLNDCAMELIMTAQRHGLLGREDKDAFVDLLVPSFHGKLFPYKEYLENLRVIQAGGVPKSNRAIHIARRLMPRPVRRVIRYPLLRLRDSLSRIFDA